MKRIVFALLIVGWALVFSFESGPALARGGRGSPQYRAVAGVSMGGYGAMNIGLDRPDQFTTIGCLGGPLDMAYLLNYIEYDMLPNYDNLPSYPGRGTRIGMLRDLSVSFGNPFYYNPESTYYPPGINDQNARQPTTLFPFYDGTLNPDAGLPAITYEDPGPGEWVEVLLALDLNGNGKRDRGEPILKQVHEAFTDTNGNGAYDPGDPFADDGLDEVPGTGDFGEGDGVFSVNPNHGNYLAEDPLSRAADLPLTTLAGLNLYMDAGTSDEFEFDIHTENFVRTLRDRTLTVRVENDFPRDFPRVNHFFRDKRVYVRYPGGHVGFDKENIGLDLEKARIGVQEAIVVANRFTTLFAFVSDHFLGGDYGTDPYELFRYPSKMGILTFKSPSLGRRVRYGIYLPPGYKRSKRNFYPVLYLLGGYNMSVAGFANDWMAAAFDTLILTGEMQKMIIVMPDGISSKTKNGHFFVNQVDPIRGGDYKDAFFDLVKFIDRHFKTK